METEGGSPSGRGGGGNRARGEGRGEEEELRKAAGRIVNLTRMAGWA